MRLRYIYQGKYPLGKYQHTRTKYSKFTNNCFRGQTCPFFLLPTPPQILKYQALPERIPSPMPSSFLAASQAIRLMPARA